jgi:hypothetical protein
MKNDAFSANVKPGGLISKDNIKILICYIIKNIKPGLSKEDIIHSIEEDNLANYFEIVDAISYLLNNNHIEKTEKSLFKLTATGKVISDEFDTTIPYTVRERVMSSALRLLSKNKIEKENKVEIEKLEYGYNVTCHVSDGNVNLMSFSLYVPDLMQANIVKENFHNDPKFFYDVLLSLGTENKDLVNDVLENIKNNKNSKLN